jgi:hypothetical protein
MAGKELKAGSRARTKTNVSSREKQRAKGSEDLHEPERRHQVNVRDASTKLTKAANLGAD